MQQSKKLFDLGRRLDDQNMFRLAEEHLATHMAVLGTTGTGKSRFLWNLMREHRKYRRGFCLIDPGDLADDFLADIAKEAMETRNLNLLKKVHVLELSPFCCARYDPFRFHYPKPIHPELLAFARLAWQHTKVQSVAEILQRKQGQTDFEGMPRLQRNLTNVLTSLATEVDHRRLSLADALIILDLGHPLHAKVYNHLLRSGRLSREVIADFETIHAFKRVQDLRTETESTLNRIRSLIGPQMAQILSGTGNEPALDLFKIIERGDYLIVKVGRSFFASPDQNRALAGLVIHDLIETVQIVPRELRRGFTLIIDEAGQHATFPDVADAMEVSRKYQLAWVLAGINLQSFRRKDFDMAPALISLCNTTVCFKQKWPEDTEVMARVIYGGNIDFTPLLQEVERHDGYEFQRVQDTSHGTNTGTNWAATDATGTQESVGNTETNTETWQDSWARGKTKQNGGSDTKTEGAAAGNSAALSASQSPIITNGKLVEMLALVGSQRGQIQTSQEASARSTSFGFGETEVEGGSAGGSHSQANSLSKGKSKTHSDMNGGSSGTSHTITEKLIHLQKVIREWVETGKLKMSVSDQMEKFRQKIQCLAKRQAAVLSLESSLAFEIETLDVPDPFASPTAQAKAVEWVKRQLLSIHPYMFIPENPEEQQECRVQQFVGDGAPYEVPSVEAMDTEDDPIGG